MDRLFDAYRNLWGDLSAGSGANALSRDPAFGRAFACDPLAAFGGIIALRGLVDGAIASLVLQHFVEVVAADEFTREAMDFFAKKPNIRLLKLPVSRRPVPGIDWKRIEGGRSPKIETCATPETCEICCARNKSA